MTLRVRLGTFGKEIGPVLEHGKKTIVFVGGDDEEEALAVGTDVMADHAQTIDANRRAEREEPGRMADLDTVARDRAANFEKSGMRLHSVLQRRRKTAARSA